MVSIAIDTNKNFNKMNKLLALVLATLCTLFSFTLCPLTKQEVKADEIPRVQVNAPDWTQKEYEDYYYQNGIRLGNPDTTLTVELTYSNVASHLTKRFPNYAGWTNYSNDCFSVAQIYNDNPLDKGDAQRNVIAAKNLENMNIDYIGCGRLALLCQMDFLGRYAGYSTIYAGTDLDTQEINLTRKILTEMDGLSGGDAGTFVSPLEFYRATKKIFEDYHLYSTDYEKELTFINVYGDTIFSTKTLYQKNTDIKNSIDKGMPVVVWTGPGNGKYALHYLNIYGYEYWTGTDSNGNTKPHLMYKITPNWNSQQDIYMDSDTLDFLSCGFFFFQEMQNRICIQPNDYNLPCAYNNAVETKSITTNNRITNITYLRAGYVNRYKSDNTTLEGQHLTLSAYKNNAGTAYIEYEFPSGIRFMTFDATLWSEKEKISISNSTIEMQYMDKDGDWITAISPFYHNGTCISTDYTLPTKYWFNPNDTYVEQKYYPTKIRIIVNCFSPAGDRNMGRLIIGTINVRTI